MRAQRAAALGLLLAPLPILIGVVVLASSRDVLAVGGDLQEYLAHAEGLLSGSVPYVGFRLEYPPLALVAMTVPRLMWPFGSPDAETFAWLFTISEACIAVLAGWLIARVSPRPLGALASWSLLVLTACVSMAWRYDLWPAVLVLAAVVAAELDHPGAAGVALGAGTMLKLFPVVVVPVLAARSIALRDRRSLARLLAGAGGVVVIVMAGSLVLAGTDALQWIWYQLDRGLQLESTGAGLLLLLHATDGLPLAVDWTFGSLQVQAPGAAVFASAAPVVEIVLVTVVIAASLVSFRRDAERLGRVPLERVAGAGIAMLVALLVPSKVFSVQYVVWFLPLVPLLAGRWRWLAVAISALSTIVYPFLYTSLWELDPATAVVLNARNLLLIILLAGLTASLARTPSPGNQKPGTAELEGSRRVP